MSTGDPPLRFFRNNEWDFHLWNDVPVDWIHALAPLPPLERLELRIHDTSKRPIVVHRVGERYVLELYLGTVEDDTIAEPNTTLMVMAAASKPFLDLVRTTLNTLCCLAVPLLTRDETREAMRRCLSQCEPARRAPPAVIAAPVPRVPPLPVPLRIDSSSDDDQSLSSSEDDQEEEERPAPLQRKREREDVDAPPTCCVCMDRLVDTIALPCMHRSVCRDCSRRLQTSNDAKLCVQCRRKIDCVVEDDTLESDQFRSAKKQRIGEKTNETQGTRH